MNYSRDVPKSRLPANFTSWKRPSQITLENNDNGTIYKVQLSEKARLTDKKACLSFP